MGGFGNHHVCLSDGNGCGGECFFRDTDMWRVVDGEFVDCFDDSGPFLQIDGSRDSEG